MTGRLYGSVDPSGSDACVRHCSAVVRKFLFLFDVSQQTVRLTKYIDGTDSRYDARDTAENSSQVTMVVRNCLLSTTMLSKYPDETWQRDINVVQHRTSC